MVEEILMEVGYEQNEILSIFNDNERSFFLQKERIKLPPQSPFMHGTYKHIILVCEKTHFLSQN
jgi:hypothetical protein